MSGCTGSITSTDGGFFGSSPIISRSGTADFPAYIRSKYPDHVSSSIVQCFLVSFNNPLAHIIIFIMTG
jgi:hypothetical protein